jgi:hypothetical protein
MSGPFRGRDQLAIRRISVLVSKLAMSTLQRAEDSADGKKNVPARDVFRRGLLAMPSKDHWQTTLKGYYVAPARLAAGAVAKTDAADCPTLVTRI